MMVTKHLLHPLDIAHIKYSRVQQKVLSLPFLQTVSHKVSILSSGPRYTDIR